MKTTYEEVYKMLDDDIKMIPVIDKKKTLVDVITRTNIPERSKIILQ